MAEFFVYFWVQLPHAILLACYKCYINGDFSNIIHSNSIINYINPNPLGCVEIILKLEDLGLLRLMFPHFIKFIQMYN